MNNIGTALEKIGRRALRSAEIFYRNSRLRNAVIATRSPRPADRFPSEGRRFVVFLITGRNFVNGGIMSICSIATETQKLLAANNISVMVCTACGEPRLL